MKKNFFIFTIGTCVLSVAGAADNHQRLDDISGSHNRSLNMISSFANQHRDYCKEQFSAHMAEG